MNKKLIIILIMILISAILLTIFTFKKESIPSDVKITEIMDNISQHTDENLSAMLELNDTDINDIYGIEPSLLEEYIIKIPIIKIRADEIAIIKVKELKDVSYIVNKVKERTNKINIEFKDYLENQYILTQKPLIISKGKYILMSISEKNEIIEEIFKSYFIKK